MIKIFLSLFFILIAVSAYPFGGMMCQMQGSSDVSGGAPACTTSTDSEQVGFLGTGTDTGTSKYVCTKFTIAGNITVTEYVARTYVASATDAVTICIVDHNAGTNLPSSLTCKAGSDKTLTGSAVGYSLANVTFTLAAGFNLDAGTYWVCNIETGSRYFEYYEAVGERSCYGNSSCAADAGWVDASVDIYGCAR